MSAPAPGVDGPPMPLAGLRVLERGQRIAGPFGCWFLADVGAGVVEIEQLDGGDSLRGGRALHQGTSP